MRRLSPFLWLVVGILAIALVALASRAGGTLFTDLGSTELARLAALVALLIFVVLGLIGRGALGKTARYALIWAMIVVFLMVGYTYRDELGDVAQRVFAEVVPGQPATITDGKDNSVIVVRSRGSAHFIVDAEINFAPLQMLVDTGASVITLTAEDARLAGIVTRDLRYDVVVSTANGTARAAPVTLDRIAIGPIEFTRVVALVAEEGALEISLLGNNFLNGLTSYTVTGNQLILTP